MLPSVPDIADRTLERQITNPYLIDGITHHPKHEHWKKTAIGINVKEVNGLLKFVRKVTDKAAQAPAYGGNFHPSVFCAPTPRRPTSSGPVSEILRHLPWLPPDFGRGFKMSPQDESLLRFCKF